MVPKIRRVAVLGAGVMGSGIAAHMANAGIPCLLLDLVPGALTDEDRRKGLTERSPAFRNRLAVRAIENLHTSRPPLLYSPKRLDLVVAGNLEDDLEEALRCDWVIEAVVENLEVKRSLFARIEPLHRPGVIVSSNTSGISIAQMVEGRGEVFRRHFLVTHFFNPVRYMKLLEIVAGPDTDPQIARGVAAFGERVLGKGIVRAKDTPNFVANRIGVFAMMHAMHAMVEDGLTIEEVDRILGPAAGRPKSAAFGTADLVGLDTLLHVSENVHRGLPGDPDRERLLPPPFVSEMVRRGWLGRKTGGGFYRMEGRGEEKTKLVLDWAALEYRPAGKPDLPSVDAVKGIDDPGKRIKALVGGQDRAGRYAWKVLSQTLLYAAARIPEIADNVFDVYNAMKWGFNWALGPFETWDALGVAETAARMRAEGRAVPPQVEAMLAAGHGSFYRRRGGVLEYYDFTSGGYVPAPVAPEIVFLPALREQGRVVRENAGASLYDLGDGVLGLEFHTKMNAVDADVIAMMNEGVALAEKEFAGLVIANHAEAFCAGANLMLVLMEAQNKNFASLERIVRAFQEACMRLRCSERPVVAAPAGLALGGGCEICLGADRIRAAAESYLGLVEVGVGLLPAGGGIKEMVIRHLEGIPEGVAVDPLPFLRKAFETIGLAKVSSSAEEARALCFLRPCDGITVARDFLIHDAKADVLALAAAGYRAPRPRTDIPAAGRGAFAMLAYGLYTMRMAGQISEYDEKIGRKIAFVLTGGDVPPGTRLSEQDFLDLEREAFLSLCGEEKTLDRIRHMLLKGRPLRN